MPEPGDLEGLDVVVESALDASDGRGPEPAALGAEDSVPLFRGDLRLGRGAGPGLFEVSSASGERRFTLYEFELTVARMLDGRRKVSEVVASGARLGIPVDVAGLNKFIRQMWHYGFLAAPDAPAPAEGGGTWPAREAWDEATRELFQTGVRFLRQGRPADAVGYFEAVLDAHPGSAEASEMLALAAKGQSLAVAPVGAAERPGPGRRHRRARRVALATAALLVAGAAAVLASRALRSAPVVAAAQAPPAAASPPPPAAPPAPEAPRWRTARVETLRHPVLAEIAAPAAGAARWRKAPLAAVSAGERLGDVLVQAGGAASPALARRIAELEQLARQDPVYRDFLEKARREQRRAARGRARSVPILAPASGVLAGDPPPATRATVGEVLARVLDPGVWLVGASLDGEKATEGAGCEVLGDAPDERARCRVLPATAGAGGVGLVTVEVATSDAPWLGGARSPAIRVAPERTALAAPSPTEPR